MLTFSHDANRAEQEMHAVNGLELSPWTPDSKSYNDPERNAFFKVPPEIERRA